MEEEIKVEGLSALYEILQSMPVKLEKNVMRGAIRAGSKPVAEDARRRAPVLAEPDPRRVAGALAKSVRIMSTNARGGVVKGGVVAGGRIKVGRGKNGAQADPFYAHMIEYGTVNHAPQPFMRPAIDTQAQAAIDATAAYIRDRVEAELSK